MYKTAPLSGIILLTNLSDVKNSYKHTTYKSNINLKWNTRSKTIPRLLNDKHLDWLFLIDHQFPSSYIQNRWFLSVIGLTSITFCGIHSCWRGWHGKKILRTCKKENQFFPFFSFPTDWHKNQGQNNTTEWTLQILSFIFLPNELILPFHSFNINSQTQ